MRRGVRQHVLASVALALLALTACSGASVARDDAGPGASVDATAEATEVPGDGAAADAVADSEVPSDGGATDGGPDAEAPVQRQAIPPSVCSVDSWCWWHPRPQGATLDAIWGVSASEIYAAGEEGMVIHFDGSGWGHIPGHNAARIADIWATGRDDIYIVSAVGNTGLYHHDGSGWLHARQWASTMLSVSGAGGAVFVAGQESHSVGRIDRLDDSGWQRVHTSTGVVYEAIWAAAADSVVAVTRTGEITRLEGDSWTTIDSGFTGRLEAVGGRAADDLFALGDRGTVLHFDASSEGWVPESTGTGAHFQGIWQGSASEAWAVGDKTGVATPQPLWRRTESDGWTRAAADPIPGVEPWNGNLNDVWGSGPADVYAVGDTGVIVHYDGDGNPAPISRPITATHFGAVWARDPGLLFAAGRSGVIMRCLGEACQTYQVGSAEISGLWGTSATDVYAVSSNGAIFHFDGRSWSTQREGRGEWLRALWGAATDDVYAVGDDGVVLRYDGERWSPMASGSSTRLWDVWGSGTGDVYAVGGDELLHHDGDQWRRVTAPTGRNFQAVWGSAADNVYAVGSNNTGVSVLHYTGPAAGWVSLVLDVAPDARLDAICGSSRENVIVSGIDGVFHFDGSIWTQQAVPTTRAVKAMACTASRTVAVGHRGMILARERPED